MIDPSGTLITGTRWAAVFCLLCGSVMGLWGLAGVQFWVRLFVCVQCIFLPLTRPLLVILAVVLTRWFYGILTWFSWACGAMPDMSSEFRHIFGCIDIWCWLQLTLCCRLQLVVSVFVLIPCLVSDFGLKRIESAKFDNLDNKLWFVTLVSDCNDHFYNVPRVNSHSYSSPGLWDGKGG